MVCVLLNSLFKPESSAIERSKTTKASPTGILVLSTIFKIQKDDIRLRDFLRRCIYKPCKKNKNYATWIKSRLRFL